MHFVEAPATLPADSEGNARVRAWRRRQPTAKLRDQQRVHDAHRRDRPVVAVDGEGVTWRGRHHYTVLAASDGQSITCSKDRSLPTEECLTFLLRYAGKFLVSFAFAYDVNKIIHNLPPICLFRLHKTGRCYWRGNQVNYRIAYTPRKSFTVSLLKLNETGTTSRYRTVKSVTVWDTFGFYQCSFVKALRDWEVGTAEEIAFIEAMKEKRGNFIEEATEKVEEYNQLECRLLVQLTEKLRDTITAADLKMRRWDGAGALAAALLSKHNVSKHVNRNHPEEVFNAYFGGRIQVLQLGEIKGPVYNYDINSSYPAVCRNLPTLHGEWRRVLDYDQSQPYAIWHCRWRMAEPRKRAQILEDKFGASRIAEDYSPIISPFPFRSENKNIHYPLQGEGWYWSPLVNVARSWWDFDILEGWVFEPESDEKPFRFIDEVYEQRWRLKRQRDPRHIVLKLALNSLYGKTAQGLGWGGRNPPFQSFVWAGLITATGQANLLRAAMQWPWSIVAFATDGVYTRQRLDVPLNAEMGSWEETTYDKMVIYQPGLYQLYQGGKEVLRTRGYHPNELDWNHLQKLWRKGGIFETYEFSVNRFLTLGVALQTRRLKGWGQWVDSPRELHLRPASGFVGDEISEYCLRWLPPLNVKGETSSRAYDPKKGRYDLDQDVRREEDEQQPDPLV